ncbi:MAG: TatD family deoxyribonuclease, partial [Desulfobacteraceae bacterium]|nr:TatD family deoxyribonuclease [Desulfobacteraceae bacterium]
MILFDSHCHIDDKCFHKDIDQILHRAAASGLKGIMVVGIDVNTSQKAIEIAQSNDGIFTSVGFHPHYAQHCSIDLMQK